MSSSRITYGIAAIVVLGIMLLAWRMWSYEPDAQRALDEAAAPVGEIDPSLLSLYSSGEYGISFPYPSVASLATSAGERTRTGLEVASLALADSSVRIFVRTGEDANNCFTLAPAEEREGTVELGGRSWETFSRESLGTERELAITQYRTHEGDRCITVETSESASGVESPLAATVLSGIAIR